MATLEGSGRPLDGVRLAFNSSFFTDGNERTVDDWWEVVVEYTETYMSTPPQNLLVDVAADILALRQSIGWERDARRLTDLHGVAAILAATLAMATHSLDRVRESRHWWRSARRAADASGDHDIRVWVRGYEAMSGLYQKRSFRSVLQQAEGAIGLAADRGSPGMMEAMACKAQVLAEHGFNDQAHEILRQMRVTFEKLPDHQTTQASSLLTNSWNWPRTRLLHTESFVYTASGRAKEAEKAQTEYLTAYPATHLRDRAQVELHRAVCLVSEGAIGDGLAHAEHVLETLPVTYHTRSVQVVARKILKAVPMSRTHEPYVKSYRERLATPYVS
jgi:hypothetical protein